MREHAIPQAVTSYEFHLIGNMTLKQFLELGAGFLGAFLIYSTNLPDIIRWPLLLLCAGIGAMIAFVPFEGRPLDQWFYALIKAIYKPTEFYWRKSETIPDYFLFTQTKLVTNESTVDLRPAKNQRISEYLHTISPQNTDLPPLDALEQTKMDGVMQLFEQVTVNEVTVKALDEKATISVAPHSLQPYHKVFEVAEPVTIIPDTVVTPEAAVAPSNPVAQQVAIPEVVVPAVDTTQTAPADASTLSNTAPVQVFSATAPTTQVITPTAAAQTSQLLPFPQKPQIPNLIVGMVFDHNGGIVENAIIEIVDTQGMPLRAVKTNSIGQFSISTPLANGDYVLNVEKDGIQFAPLSLTLNTTYVDPLDIRAVAPL